MFARSAAPGTDGSCALRRLPEFGAGVAPSYHGCRALPNLKPSTTAISLRLPVSLLDRIKVAANKRDVPYQSLIKTWLAD